MLIQRRTLVCQPYSSIPHDSTCRSEVSKIGSRSATSARTIAGAGTRKATYGDLGAGRTTVRAELLDGLDDRHAVADDLAKDLAGGVQAVDGGQSGSSVGRERRLGRLRTTCLPLR
jgi:hypothetical protein